MKRALGLFTHVRFLKKIHLYQCSCLLSNSFLVLHFGVRTLYSLPNPYRQSFPMYVSRLGVDTCTFIAYYGTVWS